MSDINSPTSRHSKIFTKVKRYCNLFLYFYLESNIGNRGQLLLDL